MSYFVIESGKVCDCAHGPTMHHGDGFLWFWGSAYEYAFKVRSHDKDSEYAQLKSWVHAIKLYLSKRKDIERYALDGVRFLIESIEEGKEANFFIQEGSSSFMFQIETKNVPNLLAYLESVLESVKVT